MPPPSHHAPPTLLSRYRGCLLGGAVGDALGAPVEFMHRSEIIARFGEPGIRDYASAFGRVGAITDDTQMTLFCAEGMLRAQVRAQTQGGEPEYAWVTSHAYLRWLLTQGNQHPLLGDIGDPAHAGWLIGRDELFHPRAPGMTCLSALIDMPAYGVAARNDSKGCGTVMRVAPIGLMLAHFPALEQFDRRVFDLGVEDAALTHGHASGQLPAGFLSLLVALLARGLPLADAIRRACAELAGRPDSEETLALVDRALELANHAPGSLASLTELGEGWVAAEALAIALYCALGSADFESALVLAVNHDGDSDSTGAITGSILGVLHGESVIPQRWLAPLEARDIIEALAGDLAGVPDWRLDEAASADAKRLLLQRYPPG